MIIFFFFREYGKTVEFSRKSSLYVERNLKKMEKLVDFSRKTSA